MRYPPLPIPPPVSFSTRASGVLRLPTLFRIAAEAGVDAIDLDLSGRPGHPEPTFVARLAEESGIPVNAVWVPRVAAGPWDRSRRESATRFAAELAEATFASTLVIDVRSTAAGWFSRSTLATVADALRERFGDDVRVAVALRAHQLEGGRGHLAQLGIFQRFVEEWDLDVALDLLGSIDPRWEVEAVINRLLPRLAVIRLGSFASRLPARGRARMTARVLAAALDAGFGGILALAPSLPVWQTGWAPALARAAAAAGDHVRLRYSAIYEQPAFDSSPDPRLRF